MEHEGFSVHRGLGPRADEVSYVESNTYYLRDLDDENEAVKQPQRERVLEAILKDHGEGRVNLFSLPGPNWRFEHMVYEARRGDAAFVAVERHWEVMQRGRWVMPGASQTREQQEFNDGRLYGVASDNAQVWWATASTFFEVRAGLAWYSRCRAWSGAWLDFSAPLNTETVKALRSVGQHLDARRRSVTIAVTLLKARETPDVSVMMNALAPGATPLDRRVAVVGAVMAHPRWRFNLVDAWEYLSAGGAPMCVVIASAVRL